jgi:hypothetical protein
MWINYGDKEGLGTLSEATDSIGTLLTWNDEEGTKHTKRIYHTSSSDIPLCHTAPTYGRYKKFLKNSDRYRVDDEHLVSMLAGSEPQLEDPYINNADFEVKDKDVQMLNMRRKVVPEDTQVDSVHQFFHDVVDETTEDVVVLPTKEVRGNVRRVPDCLGFPATNRNSSV